MVQDITGWRDHYVRRSGSMLPPPVDDYVDNESSTRIIPKVVLNVSCQLFLEPPEFFLLSAYSHAVILYEKD